MSSKSQASKTRAASRFKDLKAKKNPKGGSGPTLTPVKVVLPPKPTLPASGSGGSSDTPTESVTLNFGKIT